MYGCLCISLNAQKYQKVALWHYLMVLRWAKLKYFANNYTNWASAKIIYNLPFITNKTMPIRIYVTGGTFDKEYDMMRGQLYFKDTHLPEIFNIGRCKLDLNIRTLMMIDSLEMTDEDRDLIAHNCEKCSEDKIVITHGTDTMVKTAEIIAAANIAKTIVVTGAMIP